MKRNEEKNGDGRRQEGKEEGETGKKVYYSEYRCEQWTKYLPRQQTLKAGFS
jgi:hypothetical protein